jgi:hypothetical protein
MTLRERAWAALIRLVGGFYEAGRFAVCLHDDGITFAVDRVVRWDWRLSQRVLIPPQEDGR